MFKKQKDLTVSRQLSHVYILILQPQFTFGPCFVLLCFVFMGGTIICVGRRLRERGCLFKLIESIAKFISRWSPQYYYSPCFYWQTQMFFELELNKILEYIYNFCSIYWVKINLPLTVLKKSFISFCCNPLFSYIRP